MNEIIRELAEIYPQLYLDPDKTGIEEYQEIVLHGTIPDTKELSHFKGDERDHGEQVETPVGSVFVLTLYNRHDYEVFVRGMMAAKCGPDAVIPATQGAATLLTINWNKIRAHRDDFLKKEEEAGNLFPDWSAEFKKFTSVKSNYQDRLIVLSYGPYSNISSEAMGLAESAWLKLSRTIRTYHELTHVICRTLYPDKIHVVWDELVADAIGLYAAYGTFDPEKEALFLGIKDGHYVGGRMENYTEKAEELAEKIEEILHSFQAVITAHQSEPPFDMIPYVMELADRYLPLLGVDQ